MKYILIGLGFVLWSGQLRAQIQFQNPSFEGAPRESAVPNFWEVCSETPDICPNHVFPANLNLKAADCNTYVGLYVGSPNVPVYDAIGQKLNFPLAKQKKHTINLSLAYFKVDTSDFVPGGIRIYAGNNICDTTQLLWRSPTLDTVWHSYSATFIPNDNYQYISFWPYVDGNTVYSYILLDNLSDITIDGINDVGENNIIITNTPSQFQILNLPSKTAMSIYNLLGQLVYYNADYKNEFDSAQLPAAMYLYRLRVEGGEMRTGKMVVIH